VNFRVDRDDSDEVKAFFERGLPVPDGHRHHQLVPGLQLAGPGGGPGDTPEQQRATASCARRCPSPSTGRRATAASSATRAAWRRTARCRRACSARARASRRVQPGHAPAGERQVGAPAARTRRSCWPRPATPTAATRRPASRWC
jgi:hypothetical protein